MSYLQDITHTHKKKNLCLTYRTKHIQRLVSYLQDKTNTKTCVLLTGQKKYKDLCPTYRTKHIQRLVSYLQDKRNTKTCVLLTGQNTYKDLCPTYRTVLTGGSSVFLLSAALTHATHTRTLSITNLVVRCTTRLLGNGTATVISHVTTIACTHPAVTATSGGTCVQQKDLVLNQ